MAKARAAAAAAVAVRAKARAAKAARHVMVSRAAAMSKDVAKAPQTGRPAEAVVAAVETAMSALSAENAANVVIVVIVVIVVKDSGHRARMPASPYPQVLKPCRARKTHRPSGHHAHRAMALTARTAVKVEVNPVAKRATVKCVSHASPVNRASRAAKDASAVDAAAAAVAKARAIASAAKRALMHQQRQ